MLGVMRLLRVFLTLFCFLPLTAFGSALQESLLTPEAIVQWPMFKTSSEEENKKIEAMRKSMLEFLPRAQQILLMRDQLGSILINYSLDNPGDEQIAEKMLKILEHRFPEGKKSGDVGYLNIFFEFDPNRFQVDGIEPNRLAINTGVDIRFGAAGLMKKEKLSLADITQLWLHELSHFDKSIPLAERDQWVAKVTQWVQQRSSEFVTDDGKKLFALIMPARKSSPATAIAAQPYTYPPVYPQDIYAKNIKNSFILLQQDSQRTRYYMEAYDGFQNFDNFIKRGAPDWLQGPNVSAETVNWPTVQVTSLKMLPNKKLQIDYIQRSNLYTRVNSDARSFMPVQSYGGNTTMPSLPDTPYRIELNTSNDELEVKRKYARLASEGDFEMYQVRDKGSSRFVTLQLKLKDVKYRISSSESIHLIAKDLTNSELLSFEVKKIHYLNNDEAYLHIKVPNRNLELSQLLFPLTDRGGMYRELKLLPSRPFSLFGPGSASERKIKTKKVRIEEKQFDEDRVRAKIPLTSNKKVTAVTLDLEHKLMGLAASAPQYGGSRDLIPVGEGRKYYVKGADLESKNGVLEVMIPETMINQIQSAGTYQTRIGMQYFKQNVEVVTMTDTSERHLRGVWMHFADGSVEKVPDSKLPQESFQFDFDSARVPVKTCSDLFNGPSKADAAWHEYQSHFMSDWN